MAIKIKYKDPSSTDFGPKDIVINVKEGTIFYKSDKSIFKLKGDDLNTDTDLITYNSSISAFKGFFATPGIGKLKVEGEGIYKFKVGPLPTVEVGGHIIPSSSAAPLYDLGSITNPWRDIYFSPDSLHFVKTDKGVGRSKIGTTFRVGEYGLETIAESSTLTKSNIDNLKEGKSIQESGNLTVDGKLKVALGITLTSGGITGSIDGGFF
tara:strand:+ start:242 stop:868 length:627 start_codon:yes stop_codon:yes gene_type:complete